VTTQVSRACLHRRSGRRSGGAISHGWVYDVYASVELNTGDDSFHWGGLTVSLLRCTMVNIITCSNCQPLQRGSLFHGSYTSPLRNTLPVQAMVKDKLGILG
jgi:hypothetical protein